MYFFFLLTCLLTLNPTIYALLFLQALTSWEFLWQGWQSNECRDTQWSSHLYYHSISDVCFWLRTLSFSSEDKIGKAGLESYSAMTTLMSDIFLFLVVNRMEAEIAANKKEKKNTNVKPRDWNEAITYWFTRIISPISCIVTGCTRYCLAVLCQPNNSTWMQKWEQANSKVMTV